jgi:hypothetical protein
LKGRAPPAVMEKSLDDMIDFIEKILEAGSEVSNYKSNPIGLPIRQDGSFYELSDWGSDNSNIIFIFLGNLEDSMQDIVPDMNSFLL